MIEGRGKNSCGGCDKLEFRAVLILHYSCNHLPLLEANAHQVHHHSGHWGKTQIVPESSWAAVTTPARWKRAHLNSQALALARAMRMKSVVQYNVANMRNHQGS